MAYDPQAAGYYTPDHLDSIREVTTSSGTVAARYEYVRKLLAKRRSVTATGFSPRES